ncbi:MAG: glycosyltransferase, partial [Eubacterium sp.]|nr:glycosyltransferase [Eubacterium sp.]
KYDYEIITVVDGSPDNVFEVLNEYAKTDKKIKVVNLTKNFGQANARMATLKYATGEYVVCLDDDGQCPVNEVVRLVEPLENGYDISIADYPHKKQSLLKNLGSFFNKISTRILLDVPKDYRSTNFFAMKNYLCREIQRYKNPYPFIDGLVSQTTNKIAYVPMEERERISGKTGYNLRKLISLWLNGFTAFSVVPLRVSSILGIICAIIGFIFGIVTIIRKLIVTDIQVGWSSTVAIILFIGGLIMMMLGMIGEYIGRIYISINNSPQYVVKETINIDETDEE